jgi:hypothetical protein
MAFADLLFAAKEQNDVVAHFIRRRRSLGCPRHRQETGKKPGGRIIDRPFDLEQCDETDGMTRSGDGLAL